MPLDPSFKKRKTYTPPARGAGSSVFGPSPVQRLTYTPPRAPKAIAPYKPGYAPSQVDTQGPRSQAVATHRDERVALVQSQLKSMGYNIAVDGVMGPETRSALAISNNATQPNHVYHPQHADAQARRQVAREEKDYRARARDELAHTNAAGRAAFIKTQITEPTPAEDRPVPQAPQAASAHHANDVPIWLVNASPEIKAAYEARTGKKIPSTSFIPEHGSAPALQSILGSTGDAEQQKALAAFKAQNEPSPILTGLLHPATDLIRQATGQSDRSATGVASDVGQLLTYGIPGLKAGNAIRGVESIVRDVKTATSAEGVGARALAVLRDIRGARGIDALDARNIKTQMIADRALEALPIQSPERTALRKSLSDAGVKGKDLKAGMRLWDGAAQAIAKSENMTTEQAYREMISHAEYHDVVGTTDSLKDGALPQVAKLTKFPFESSWENPASLKESMLPKESGVPFVSKLGVLVADMPEKVGAQELLGKIKSAGIKADEIKWTKFDKFIETATAKGQKSITRDEAMAWLNRNYLKLEENRRFQPGSQYSDASQRGPDSDQSLFGQYTIPGGKDSNYQEFTIRLPEADYGEMYKYTGHYPDANIVAHVRTTDRVIGDDHTLMVEEIQSDWHQAGQKQGYKVPVEEHPDYQMRQDAVQKSGDDLNAGIATFRRTVTDALLRQGELPSMPDALTRHFEQHAEQALGVMDSSAPQEWRELGDKVRFAEIARNAGSEAYVEEIPPTAWTNHSSWEIRFKNGEQQIIQPAQAGFPAQSFDREMTAKVFHEGRFDAPDEAKKAANKYAVEFNALVDLPQAEFESVKNATYDVTSGWQAHDQAKSSLQALSYDASRGVSDAPFQKTWHELAFKRMLSEAVDKGYKRVAWTTGKTQAERYDLANFFSRIEVEGGAGGRYGQDIWDWAREMAESSAENADDETLGLDSYKEQDLRDEAESYVGSSPAEEDHYIEDPETGEQEFDQESYDDAHQEWLDEVDARYEKLVDSWREDALNQLISDETDYYVDNSHEYGYRDGDIQVTATTHDGRVQTYDASERGSGDENALENIIGEDLAQRYENGETTFEGDNLAAGNNVKSALGASHFYDNKLTGFVNKYLKKTGIKSEVTQLGSAKGPFRLRVEMSPHTGHGYQKYWILDGRGDYPIHNYFEALRQQHTKYGDIPKPTIVHKSLVDVYGPGHYADPNANDAKVWVQWSDFPQAAKKKEQVATVERGAEYEDFGSALWGPYDNTEQAASEVEDSLINLESHKWGGTSPGAGTEVHSIPISDEVRAFVDQGQALFQRDPLVREIGKAQRIKGAVRLGGRDGSELHLFRGADSTTHVHELGHIIQQYLPHTGLDPEEFARSFEQYVINGKAPTEETRSAFLRLSVAMKRVYDIAPGEVLTPELQHVLDGFFRSAAHIEPQFIRGLAALHFQDGVAPGGGDPMIEAAAMQSQLDGFTVESAAKLFGVDQEKLQAYLDSPEYKAAQDRIHGNQQLDSRYGAAETEHDAKHYFDKWFPQEADDESLANTHEPISDQTPKQQLRQGLKGARSRYGIERSNRHEDLKMRIEEAENAFRTIDDPDLAMAAASSAMKGKYATIDFKGLRDLTPEVLRDLKREVKDFPTMGVLSKKRVMQALDAAVNENRVPRPNEIRLIEHIFGASTARSLLDTASKGKMDRLIDILNIPRTLMATADLSGLGRQSLVAGTSHPVLWSKNIPMMLKSTRSSKAYDTYMEAIKKRPLYDLALQAKVSFTDLGEGSSLTAHEESFASDYAVKILEASKIGKPGAEIIKGSARAYVSFLNKMRMDLFENRIRIALAAGQDVHNEEFLRDIGHVINAATGRGAMFESLEHVMPALNTVMFSPRLMLSRINYLDPTWYVRLQPQARREALRGLFATAGAVTGALWMFSQIPGVNVGSLDPRSADFGKLKHGNIRLDVAGGFQQYVRLVAELTTNAYVSSTTGRKTELGSKYGTKTGLDVAINFFLGKASPPMGILANELRGKDMTGSPTPKGDPTWILKNNFVPLLLQDAKAIYNEKHGGVDGITWALGGYGVGALGLGLQTYAAKNPGDAPQAKLSDRAKAAGLGEVPKNVQTDVDHKAHLDDITRSEKDRSKALKQFVEYYKATTGDSSFDDIPKQAGKNKTVIETYMRIIRNALVDPSLSSYEHALKTVEGASGG